MNITLKKASAAVLALTAEISNTRNQLQQTLIVRTTIHSDLYTVKENARVKSVDTLEKLVDKIVVLYSIRAKVSAANHQHGIDVVLNEIAFTDAKLSALSLVANAGISDDETIRKHMTSAKNRYEKDTNGYASEDVTFMSMTEELVAPIKEGVKGLKRMKRELQDRLLELNISNKISLSEKEVEILTELAVI